MNNLTSKTVFSGLAVLAAAVSFTFAPGSFAEAPAAPSPADTAAQPPVTVNFDRELSAICSADSEAAVMKAADEALARCASHDDFERFVSGLKGMVSGQQGCKRGDAVFYLVARTRLDELSALSAKNDIESGRLYMALKDSYRKEASEFMDRALAITKSKDLILDTYYLQFVSIKDDFLPQRADALIDQAAEKISKYSDDKMLNNRQLNRMADKFINGGFADYALKLKLSYAGKLSPELSREVFEEVRRDGDKNFAQGNMKDASKIYAAYISAGESIYTKEVMAGKVMEIAEKYFGSGKYREALQYYLSYAEKYPDSKVMDYCKYKTALSYYNEKNYKQAVESFEDFLKNYQDSVWFDKAFETLCRLYFCDYPGDKAIAAIQSLADNYYRKNTGDYAYMLIGLLRYVGKEYDKAIEAFKKIGVNSVYSYAAETVMTDIKDIKKGSQPSFTFGSKDRYRMWEPYKQVTVEISPMESGDAGAWLKGAGKGSDKRLEITYDESGAPHVTVKPGAKILFSLSALSDEDRFSEYLQDKEDLSRLPKKVKEDSEKDLVTILWSSGGGKFVDDRQSRDKSWQAAEEQGTYKISVAVEDFGLVRSPDKGIRKDPAKESHLNVDVKE